MAHEARPKETRPELSELKRAKTKMQNKAKKFKEVRENNRKIFDAAT
jgi:hypothetical protein